MNLAMTRTMLPIARILMISAATFALTAGSAAAADNGLLVRPSKYAVGDTVEKIEAAAKARGLVIFARIDHAGEAQKVGLTMKPTVLILIGSPKAGTPVMLAAPSAAIDLPLKALVAESADGSTTVTFNDPAYLKARHGLPEELQKNVSGLGPLLDAALQ